ncbi:MAG: 4Fe-4S binding protein, partial [Hyphomicrobiaceae bacterium]
AKGHLGAFEIEVNGYAPVLPSSRAGLEFALTRDGAKSTCDLILDLSGGKPLFAGSAGRDGYLHVDPNDPVAVANALFDLADLVGEFEKPLYVGVDAATCAHARSQKVGCTRCLDTCPTGAIAPVGDHVAVDPGLCGGCGTCSAVCPTGAISYAFPGREDLIARVQIMLRTYRAAGGRRPVVLLHDERHGGGLIAAMARGGNGLPPNVLPMTLYSVFQIGHDSLAAILAAGAEQIVVMVPPDRPHDVPALAGQIDLLSALLGGLGYAGPRLHLLSEQDPDAAETFLYGLSELPGLMPHAVPLEGSKRHIARGVLAQLAAAAPTPQSIVALPKGAPYGRIHIDTAGCTLCLSCVGACPAHAIGDAPDRPQVAFTEAACVQCGICVATCPERVITLEPRYNFLPAALSPEVLNSEEPFACVRCGKPFGTKATIAKIVGRLAGHSMFRNEKQLRIVQMCDTCRVVTVSEEGIDPFRGGERPRIRTTDDYLAERAKKTGKTPDDFLS